MFDWAIFDRPRRLLGEALTGWLVLTLGAFAFAAIAVLARRSGSTDAFAIQLASLATAPTAAVALWWGLGQGPRVAKTSEAVFAVFVGSKQSQQQVYFFAHPFGPEAEDFDRLRRFGLIASRSWPGGRIAQTQGQREGRVVCVFDYEPTKTIVSPQVLIAELLDYLRSKDSAALQMGTDLLVKYEDPALGPRVVIQSLGPSQRVYLQRNPNLYAEPNRIIEVLSAMHDEEL